ncbi:Probable membrane-bound lytic murein transglycosylase precursor [Flavobacterium indicum GPTSA100-9 = DSM 17447]|uniref:Probable membrane-bound lytic murein transglycosylase n=1 Tax=Flavobacterium indicum (strain DSM 17447 / CIP 109464 / GPTSA100-9) TaxID=1094466 RepID=H8XNC2_FLAIG|nr:lytic transglycosylase domain-containing protein [Flavobacterium indicum]CCG52039.1 Probable membrane-bound lytic murein transglycosylase precursor [Flavobacterium indicum GPTSA100-9 = DSM 17447]
MRKLLIIALSVMAGEFSIAQESQEKELPLFAPKVSYLDSLKSTFVNHSTSSCIDERWMNELANSQLSKEMFYDIEHLNIDEKVNYDFDTELFKNRLKKLDARSPFVIEYNPTLENTIKAFLKNRSKSIERQMALAEYYFPMFEEHLAKYNLPLEIKYLAIVESALNPKAKSRVGAGGIWQFMPATGKQYKLDISSYIDERHDPLKATEAMCHYMTNMYAIFGDWSLVLASYNCGPGNVSKAIRRAGGSTDYWEIRKYLPQETANYVPAFLATMYIYEFKKEYGLVPQKASVTYFETDTVAVKKAMSFKQLSELLDVSIEELEFFNPTYSKNHIPSYEDEIYFLRLPKNKIGLFVSNEEKIYAYVDYLENEKIRKAQLAKVQKRDSIAKKDSVAIALATTGDVEYEKVIEKRIKEIIKKDYHKVKKGETLSEIADKHNVSITDLRKWNKIKGSNINFGQSLVIQTKKKVSVNEVVKKPIKKSEIKPSETDVLVADTNPTDKTAESKEVVTTSAKKDRIEIKEDFYIVQKGDSIFSITKKFPNLTVEDLKKKNNLPNNNIQPGMKLKIQG